ncbi:MAG: metallophosphoesterase [Bacteroidota bacterium]
MNLFVRLLIISTIFLLIDIYAFQALKRITVNKLFWLIYWASSIAVLLNANYVMINFSRYEGPTIATLNASGWLLLLYIPKLMIVFVLLGEDLMRVLIVIWNFIYEKFFGANTNVDFIPERRKLISQLAFGLAAIPFASIVYGIAKGKYNFKVIKHDIWFDDLPEEFDGFQITQISDVHSGSFNDRAKISYAIDLINEQESDIVVFTGDLINNKAEEMLPWIDCFKRINAKEGKFSILGNHDYGDYITWRNKEEKVENLNKLKDIHKETGFDLLLNSSRKLKRNEEYISLVGVENWGVRFKQKGDLKKAMDGVGFNDFKVLLSHDPSHWTEEVKNYNSKIHLTLSGHTHGMQFGIEIPGFSWSPVQYMYKHWAGLFEKAGRYLYVNRGFGFHAFPGRVGIWPEITVLKLRKIK